MLEKVVNVRATHSATCDSLSRKDLLAWVNDTLKADFVKVDNLCTGAAYCQLMHSLFPAEVPLSRVKLYTNIEHEFFHNFKILQTAFQKLGVEKSIPIDRLCKGRFQDNIEFLQWFKKFYEANKKEESSYDPIIARNGEPLGFGKKNPKRKPGPLPRTVVVPVRGKETYRSVGPMGKENEMKVTLQRSLTKVEFKGDYLPSKVSTPKSDVSDIDETSCILMKSNEYYDLSYNAEQNQFGESPNEVVELRDRVSQMDSELQEVRAKLVSVKKTRDKHYLKLKEIGFCIKEAEDAGNTSVETLKITNILLGNSDKTQVGDGIKEKENTSVEGHKEEDY